MKQDEMIELDSEIAKQFGFTSDKFDGYLWITGKKIFISFIESKQAHKGNLKALFDKIEELGYSIIVPTPFPRMQRICEIRGMKLCADGEYEFMMKVG